MTQFRQVVESCVFGQSFRNEFACNLDSSRIAAINVRKISCYAK